MSQENTTRRIPSPPKIRPVEESRTIQQYEDLLVYHRQVIQQYQETLAHQHGIIRDLSSVVRDLADNTTKTEEAK